MNPVQMANKLGLSLAEEKLRQHLRGQQSTATDADYLAIEQLLFGKDWGLT